LKAILIFNSLNVTGTGFSCQRKLCPIENWNERIGNWENCSMGKKVVIFINSGPVTITFSCQYYKHLKAILIFNSINVTVTSFSCQIKLCPIENGSESIGNLENWSMG
jgi:hypothetical protein